MGTKSGERESRGVEVEAVAEDRARIPSWFGEAVLFAKYWWDSGLVGYLEEEVRVVRGRMGQYEVQDFVLLLNSYAISGEKSLSDFFKALAPVQEVLMSLWERRSCPSASSLSRFLAAVAASGVESLRALFESDLGRNSVRVESGIGMFDRNQAQSVGFDIDGTVCAVRQRSIRGEAQNDPPGVHRSQSACAPGYKGRKRGEVIRNRTTVSQAQTSEWLGTYGSAGNGATQRELERSCQGIVRYLQQQGLQAGDGLVRLDGLYGNAALVSVVQSSGLGYIVRCRDYHLLQKDSIQKRLESSAAEDWQTLSTNNPSQWLDLGYIEDLGRGYATPMRILVLRTPVDQHRVKVGKRMKGQVYELFLTSQSPASLSGTDVLSLYRGRGGFEQRLSEEDQEQDYDRWCSWSAAGQEFWQILGQWSWNWRVWMGTVQQPVEIRRTEWVPGASELGDPAPLDRGAISVPQLTPSLEFLRGATVQNDLEAIGGEVGAPVPVGSKAGVGILYGAMQVSTEWGRGLGREQHFGNADFKIVNEKTVLCPAGHAMYRRASRQKANGDLSIQFGINPKTCQSCPVKKRCLAPKSKGVGGRRVNVVRQRLDEGARVEGGTTCLSSDSALVRSVMEWLKQEQPNHEQPIYWCDIAATRLRRGWHQRLALQAVEIQVVAGDEPPSQAQKSKVLSRRQREHHRLSWWERNERNEWTKEQGMWKVVLSGEAKELLAGLHQISRRSFLATG